MYVLTGGGTGIGRCLAESLSRRGKSVLIVGRREQILRETAASSPLIEVCCADVSTDAGREKLALHLTNQPTLDGLIHNAGSLEPISSLARVKKDAWEQSFALNVHAPLFLTQCLLPKLDNARVLNIGSAGAHFPVLGWGAYCVTKAALFMLTQCFQQECGSLTAFASVMPGMVDTDIQARIRQGSSFMDKDTVAFYQSMKAGSRLLKAETVALFLTWLLLDIATKDYVAREWDIYDTSHHASWLPSSHILPHWEQ